MFNLTKALADGHRRAQLADTTQLRRGAPQHPRHVSPEVTSRPAACSSGPSPDRAAARRSAPVTGRIRKQVAAIRVPRLLLPILVAFALLASVATAIPARSATPVASPAASPLASPAAVKLPKNVPAGAEPGQIRDYLDGAVLKVRTAGATEEVVLIGVDAALKKNQAGTNDCFASEFAARLRKLVPLKSTVFLERDKTDRDSDGRLPRFVWVPTNKGDDKAYLLNTKLVNDGTAKLGSMAPSGKYAVNFAKSDQRARDGNRGLWGACYAPNGQWFGTTTEGEVINFTIVDHGLKGLTINYTCAVESGYVTVTSTTSWNQPRPMEHDGFNISSIHPDSDIVFTGGFTSLTEASGTLQVVDKTGGCAGLSLTTSWHATRQESTG